MRRTFLKYRIRIRIRRSKRIVLKERNIIGIKRIKVDLDTEPTG